MMGHTLLCLPFMKTMQDHDETQKEVDEVLELFRYLPAKDIFEAFYNKRLARRLLMNLSYSFDLERHVLDMLKKGKRERAHITLTVRVRVECGDAYTSKAEEILKDVLESRNVNKDFNEYLV